MAYYCKFYNSPASTLSKKIANSHDSWIPEADIFETKLEIITIINLPGVEAKDIEALTR